MDDLRVTTSKLTSLRLPISAGFAFLSELFSCTQIRRQNHYQPEAEAPYIPPEILSDILSRLPVKLLLRFRCVSKSWRNLIDSHEFSNMHLKRSLETSSNFNIFLAEYHSLYSIDLDSVGTRSATIAATKLDQPFNRGAFEIGIIGSCNGLLCLSIEYFEDAFSFVIWNPSTRKHRKLPELTDFKLPPEEQLRDLRVSCGFGYDPVGDQYKVLLIIEYHYIDGSSIESEAKVYATKSDTWRPLLDDLPYTLLPKSRCGKLVNGKLHWPVTEKAEPYSRLLIAAIDLGTEKCRLVSKPERMDHDLHTISLEVLGGCLALICYYPLDRFDVWVMKEYGVGESWTKLVSIPCSESFADLSPLAWSNRREHDVLFMQFRANKELDGDAWPDYYTTNYGFVWYNTENKSVSSVSIRGLPSFLQANLCVESLVQVPDSCSSNGGLCSP